MTLSTISVAQPIGVNHTTPCIVTNAMHICRVHERKRPRQKFEPASKMWRMLHLRQADQHSHSGLRSVTNYVGYVEPLDPSACSIAIATLDVANYYPIIGTIESLLSWVRIVMMTLCRSPRS